MAGGANPAQTQVPNNVFQQSSQALSGAYGATAGAMGMPNVAAYQNPYTQQVTNRAIGDIQTAQAQGQNALDAQAGAAGAFGGSRHGVAQGMMADGYAKQIADTTAGLNMQGYNTALGAAQQGQGNQMAGAAQLGNLANLGFGFGQQINAQQSQQGAMQQAMQQALIDAAKGQYAGFTNAPQNALSLPLQALGAATPATGSTTTNSKTNGVFDYISALAPIGATLFCWVAREVYGPDDQRWIEFREWLLHRAPPRLARLYARHGERAASVVRRVPILKRALRPLMDMGRRRMGFK